MRKQPCTRWGRNQCYRTFQFGIVCHFRVENKTYVKLPHDCKVAPVDGSQFHALRHGIRITTKGRRTSTNFPFSEMFENRAITCANEYLHFDMWIVTGLSFVAMKTVKGIIIIARIENWPRPLTKNLFATTSKNVKSLTKNWNPYHWIINTTNKKFDKYRDKRVKSTTLNTSHASTCRLNWSGVKLCTPQKI